MGATCSSMCCEGPTVAYPLHRGGQNCVVVRNQFRSKQHRANSGGSSPRKAHRVPACIVASNDEVVAPSQSGAATSTTVGGMTTRLADGSSGTLLLGPGHSVLLQVATHHQRNGSGGDHMLRVAPVTKLQLKAPLLCPSAAEASPTTSPRAHMPPRDDIFEPTENKLSNPFEPPVRWPRTTLAPRSSWSGDCSADEIPGNPSSGNNNNNTNARKTSPSNGRWFTPAAAGGAVMSVTSPTNQQVSVTEQQQRAAPRIRELSVSFSFQRVNLLGNDGDAEDFGDLHSAPEERSESRMQSGHAASVDELLMPVGQPFSPGAPLDRCNTAAGLNDAFGDE